MIFSRPRYPAITEIIDMHKINFNTFAASQSFDLYNIFVVKFFFDNIRILSLTTYTVHFNSKP